MYEPLPELKFITNPQRFKIATHCPCDKDNRDNKFVPFEGYTDKGYCHSCGKTFHPEVPHFENRKEPQFPKLRSKVPSTYNQALSKSVTSIPFDFFEQSVSPANIKAIRANSSLFQGLLRNNKANIPETRIIEAMNRFYVGYSGYRFTFTDAPGYLSPNGANILYLIDEQNRIRGGQVILFDSDSLKCSTLKIPFRHTRPVYCAIEKGIKNSGLPVPDWLKIYKDPQVKKMPCLFGLPQLHKEPITKPIAICEAPKTALIGWIYFPEFIWLAVGSKGMLKVSRLRLLAGRSITLFPDLSTDGETFNLWNDTAKEMEREFGGKWNTSRVLEDAPDLTDQERKGGDLADYLLTRWDWLDFQKEKGHQSKITGTKTEGKRQLIKLENPPALEKPDFGGGEWPPFATGKEVDFNTTPHEISFEVEELESFFSSHLPPEGPMKLGPGTITDIPLFVRSHMATIKANQGKRSFKPYYERLQQLKEIIKNLKNN